MDIFRILFIGLLVLMVGIRGYYQSIALVKAVAPSQNDKLTFKEGWLNLTLRSVLGLAFLVSLIAYVGYPQAMAWSALPLPVWVRWVGFGVGLLSLLLLFWVHHSLGENFSSTLHVREKQTLVTYGPYRWVRHPMYTTLYLLVVAFFLLSANWFIGLTGFGGLTGVVAFRLKREEEVMIEKFGDDYRNYMGRTGRFLPRLSH